MAKYGKTKVPLLTIPKGTLLFRATENQKSDFEGVNDCFSQQYNVFFYFSPFVVDGIPQWFSDVKNVHIYVASHDLKVASLILPSKFTRKTRIKKNQFMLPCNKTRKSCLTGRYYDPCFRESFLEKNPSVLGWIAISHDDANSFKKSVKDKLVDKEKADYVKYVSDKEMNGPPEIAVYPLKERNMEDVVPPKDKSLFNYEFITSLSREGSSLKEFMDKHAVRVIGKWYYKYHS